jgi:ATP-dependent RNA helicase DDX51/DBP6
VKRDRRKKKKAATKTLPTNVNKLRDSLDSKTLREDGTENSEGEQNSVYEDEEHSDAESSDAETLGNDSFMPPVPLPSVLIEAHAERPRKRRKIVDEAQGVGSLAVLPALSASREASPSGKVSIVDNIIDRQTPGMGPLVAFPLPSTPAATSQKGLALQGLDPGLIDAEIIDFAHTISIGSHDTNRLGASSNLGLSLKTQKRLKELGITELFAGRICSVNRSRLLSRVFDLIKFWATSAICSHPIPPSLLTLPACPVYAI